MMILNTDVIDQELPSKVKSISLAHKSLSSLPNYILMYKNIERLNLSNNNLIELPKTILSLKKIRSLSLAGNTKLKWADVFALLAEFPRLKKLDLSACNIKHLPAEIFHLSNLKTLILDDNPIDALSDKQLMNLPDRLEELSINNCMHQNVSHRLKCFNNLKEIRIDYCEYDYMININLLQPKLALAVM